MTLKNIFNADPDIKALILCGSIVNDHEGVFLLDNGKIVRTDFSSMHTDELFSVSAENNPKQGFCLTSKCCLYVMDDIVAIANEFGQHGYVFIARHKTVFPLLRDDKYLWVSSYPIALYKDSNGTPSLMYGAGENSINVINLDTMELIAKGKSMIGDDIEEKFLNRGSDYVSMNRYPYQHGYHYYFSKLSLSPDNSKLLNHGWVMGSVDYYTVYDVNDFVYNSKYIVKQVMLGEHDNRAACWVDDEHVAVADDLMFESGESDKVKLYIYNIACAESLIIGTFELDAFEHLKGQLYFSQSLDCFVVLSSKGLTVCSRKGEILLVDASFKAHHFNPELNLFLCIDGNRASMWKLSN